MDPEKTRPLTRKGILTRRTETIELPNRNDRVQEQQRTQMAKDLPRDISRARGPAHPLCFTERVIQHQFLEGFKRVNIESHDGTTDPVAWIDDFLLHIHIA